MTNIQGVLLGIDGVLHVGLSPLPGAAEVLSWLEQRGYAVCFLTKSTITDHSILARSLQNRGLLAKPEQILPASVATANYLRQYYAGKRCFLLTKGDTTEDFAGIDPVDDEADVMVIGGTEELLSYEKRHKRSLQRLLWQAFGRELFRHFQALFDEFINEYISFLATLSEDLDLSQVKPAELAIFRPLDLWMFQVACNLDEKIKFTGFPFLGFSIKHGNNFPKVRYFPASLFTDFPAQCCLKRLAWLDMPTCYVPTAGPEFSSERAFLYKYLSLLIEDDRANQALFPCRFSLCL